MTEFICLDFETAFDREYSLSRMTTESYVRDPRFKAHMVGISINTEPAFVIDPHVLLDDRIWRERIQNSMLLCHHAHFDGLILSHHFGLRPKFWFDTLSMARATLRGIKVGGSLAALAKHYGLAEKNVPYDLFRGVRDLPHDIYSQLATGCAHDVDLTVQVFRNLIQDFPREELKVIDQVVRMFTEPTLQLDVLRMQKFLNTTRADKARLLAEAGVTEAQMQSSDLFAEALGRLGYACPMKWSEAQQKEIPALAKSDDGMKELEEHDDPRVQALASARLGSKSTIDETRTARLLDASSRGPLPVYLSYGAAKTLRFGGGDKTNWQNFRRGGEIRASIEAPEGHVIAVVDASQVECRGLNWLAGQRDILDAFASGRDIYSEGASKFYERPITKADKLERHLGKTLELGCGFGLGPPKFQRTCGAGALGGPPIILTDNEAERAVYSYRAAHPAVVAMWKVFNDQILPALFHKQDMDFGPAENPSVLRIRNQKIYLPNDSFLDYTRIRWGYFDDRNPAANERPQWWVPSLKGWSKYYGGRLVENVVQALFSGLLIRQAMVRIGARYKIVLQVHDEVVYIAPIGEADEALSFGVTEMKRVPSWATGLPLDAEGGYARNYAK